MTGTILNVVAVLIGGGLGTIVGGRSRGSILDEVRGFEPFVPTAKA